MTAAKRAVYSISYKCRAQQAQNYKCVKLGPNKSLYVIQPQLYFAELFNRKLAAFSISIFVPVIH